RRWVTSPLRPGQSWGTRLNGVWYKPVDWFILPKGFEGTLVWESPDLAGLTTVNTSREKLNNGGGVLKFSSVPNGFPFFFTDMLHFECSGLPRVGEGSHSNYDMASLWKVLHGHRGAMQTHGTRLQMEDGLWKQEGLRYGDIVFVDIVDTYRNVPSKLLQFYKWWVDNSLLSYRSVGNAAFDLLLKTDDDCYIDVDKVLMKIDQKDLKRRNFWWGNFRQSWAVDRIGKWQELEYASPAYPAFACGSGYVASRDLVQWLASNAEQLKAYQGEDVSMGIWMAAVGPQKYQDAGWLCEKECYQDMLSSPQHSPEELRTLWARKRACGDPCGCPWGHS
ncbi:unnamed protein product, partial [Coregonus sp. 'balchen']